MRTAFDGLCEFDLVLPQDAAGLKAGSHSLYFCIDDASHYLFPAHLKPSAVWLIDTQMTYRADRIMARRFDYVFSAQKDGAERLNVDGIATAEWLPTGVPPKIYPNERPSKRYDVGFVGSPEWGRRKRLLDRLKARFPNSYIGRAAHAEMGRIYAESKIVFNDSPLHNLNMRVFEALGSGSCMVCNLDPFGLTDLLTPGVHFVGYDREEQVIPLIEKYLADDAAREKIAKAGHDLAMSKHLYRHRAEEVLRRVFSPRPDEPKPLPPTRIPEKLDRLRIKGLEQLYKTDWHLRHWLLR